MTGGRWRTDHPTAPKPLDPLQRASAFRDDPQTRAVLRELATDMLKGPVTVEQIPPSDDPYAYDQPIIRFRLRWSGVNVRATEFARLISSIDDISDRAYLNLSRALRQLAMRMDAVERGGYD